MFISKVYTVCAIIYPFGSFSCFNILTKQLPKLYIWIIKYVICFFFSFNKEIRFVQAYLIWPKIKYILILPSAVSESIILTLFRNLRAYKRSSKMFRRQFNPQLIFENVSEWFDNKPVWLYTSCPCRISTYFGAYLEKLTHCGVLTNGRKMS